MSFEWNEISLGEVVGPINTGLDAIKRAPIVEFETGIRCLRIQDVSQSKSFSNWGHSRVTPNDFEKYRLRKNEIIMARTCSPGLCFLVKENVHAVFNNGLARVRADESRVTPKFLYYIFKAQDFAEYIYGIAHGTSVQLNMKVGDLARYKFKLPPLFSQNKIAEILSTLDDRITLLRETNATLEAITQALFKSWFVDFDPVRAKLEGRAPEGMDDATAALFPDGFEESELGLVPRGWRVLPIGDAVAAVGGATPDTKNPAYWEPAIHCWTTPKDLSGIAAPILLDTERRLSDEGLAKIGSGALPIGTLLLSSRAPIGYIALAQVPLAINQGYIAMLPGGLLPPLYMLFWCRQNMENIKGRANGSTFMEISKKAFRPIPALVPPPEIVQAFVDVAGVLFERLIENEKQAQTLATLRDTLLPRLISGALRLPEVT